METTHSARSPERRALGRIMRLRLAFAGFSAAAIIVLAVVMSYTTRNSIVVNPVLLMVPIFGWIGFGVYCSEQRCPRCDEKFFGHVFRFFYAGTCQSCGFGAPGR